MSDTELIAIQAKTIEELKQRIDGYEKAVKEVNMILYAVGAPLNDNRLRLTKEQLVPFFRIAQALGI